MAAAAAEAPVGNHHVLATKKYVLAMVISQMTQRRTSPIYQSPALIDEIRFPICNTSRACFEHATAIIGRSVSQLDAVCARVRASRVQNCLPKRNSRDFSRRARKFAQRFIDAGAGFFVTSRPIRCGSGEMVRISKRVGVVLFQLGG